HSAGIATELLLGAGLGLGGPEGAGGKTAVRRAARDRAFALLVEAWEQRLAPWAAEIREVSPLPQVWDRISSALPAQTTRDGLWHSLNFWRGLSFAAGAPSRAGLAGPVHFGKAPPPQAPFPAARRRA